MSTSMKNKPKYKHKHKYKHRHEYKHKYKHKYTQVQTFHWSIQACFFIDDLHDTGWR